MLQAPSPDRPHDAGPLNPFETAFALIRALKDDIQNLKSEVDEFKGKAEQRFQKVEGDLDSTTIALTKRCEQLEAADQDDKLSTNMRFERMNTHVEDIRKVKQARLDNLDAQMKAEMNVRFEQNQALDQKLRNEASNLRKDLDKLSNDVGIFKNKVADDTAADRSQHNELRHDAEKLAALLSDSSLTRDPFSQLGYHNVAVNGQHTPLGATAHGRNLPPVMLTSGRMEPLQSMSGSAPVSGVKNSPKSARRTEGFTRS
mmetsp:Transcript_87511/g.173678  ORF Transcript_87511/g.173678 Transcript_87511/m.173678 type:complete len:258 (+) Transcript_87511:97-870(+)